MTRRAVAFIGSPRPAARTLFSALVARYGQVPWDRADVVVAVGGDGTALAALMAGVGTDLGGGDEAGVMRGGPPVYLVRTAGSVGFLGQAVTVEDLPARLDAARAVTLHPLRAEASRRRGPDATLLGLNDVVLIRSRLQRVRLRLTLHGDGDGGAVTGDGLVVATPVGSTAYTRSLGGPSLPLGCEMLALTAIAPAPDHAWPSLVVPNCTSIRLDVVDAEHRPVRLETSGAAIEDVERVRVTCDRTIILTLLVDPDPLAAECRYGQIARCAWDGAGRVRCGADARTVMKAVGATPAASVVSPNAVAGNNPTKVRVGPWRAAVSPPARQAGTGSAARPVRSGPPTATRW